MPRPPTDREFVYFVRQGHDGPVKIGKTVNLRERMHRLRTGSPVELVLLGLAPASGDLERDLHTKFRGIRLGGEWFKPTKALLKFAGQWPVTRQEAAKYNVLARGVAGPAPGVNTKGAKSRGGPTPHKTQVPGCQCRGCDLQRKSRARRLITLTPELIEAVAERVRQGAYQWVAATACGIPKSTFNSWIRQPGEPYETFRAALDEAVGAARHDAEERVFRDKPEVWLQKGPGRERAIEEPGWSDSLKLQGQVVQVGASVDLGKLSDGELDALMTMLGKLTAGEASVAVDAEAFPALPSGMDDAEQVPQASGPADAARGGADGEDPAAG